MRIAYLECFSGISGDMFLGALVDAGVPFDLLQSTVADLNLGAVLELSRVERCGIAASKIDVIVTGQKDLPREEYLSGQTRAAAHDQEDPLPGSTTDSKTSGERAQHDHVQSPEPIPDPHQHEHTHSHAHDGERASGIMPLHDHAHRPSTGVYHQHQERRLRNILSIIAAAKVSQAAKRTASEIFMALAGAEAKVHNVGLEEVHFHEVGAVDAIVDIICAAVGADAMDVAQFVSSPLNVGGGTVSCAHGLLPVPAPATVELLRGVPIHSGEVQKELVTPTGAAIAKVLVSSFGSPPAMKIVKVGYGAGTRDFPAHPNVLRLIIGETTEVQPRPVGAGASYAEEEIAVLEANVDDMTPQLIGYLMEQALDRGALDVFTTPVQMKKSRPGALLTVLAKVGDERKVLDLLFQESSTLGVRTRHEKRYVLARRHQAVNTPWGEVRIKIGSLKGAVSQYAPEYEDCRRIAIEHRIPLKMVMQEAIRLYLEHENG